MTRSALLEGGPSLLTLLIFSSSTWGRRRYSVRPMFSGSSDPTLLLTFPADWTCKTGIRNPFVPGYTPAATPVVPFYIYSSPSSSLNPDGAPSSLCSFLGSINDFHCLNPTERHSVNSNVSLAILEKPSCNHSSRGNKIAANSLLLLSNPREITREDE